MQIWLGFPTNPTKTFVSGSFDHPACTGRVVEVVNDRLKVRVGVLEHWVTGEEIVRWAAQSAKGRQTAMSGGRRPRGLRSSGHQGGGDGAEENRMGAGRGKGETNSRGGFDDAGPELQ